MADILVVAGVAAGGASFTYNKGCASVSNAGAGLNDIVLNNPADSAECILQATPQGTAAASLVCSHVSDTVKRVKTYIDDPVSGVPVLSDLVPFTFSVTR